MASRGSIDEEDYWGASKATTKLKAFGNQFDDDEDISSFKDVIKNLDQYSPHDDDDDVINWDGSTYSAQSGLVSTEGLSARYKPGGSTSQSHGPASSSTPVGNHGNTSTTRAPLRPVTLQGPNVSTTSIEDVVKKPVGTKTDVAKLEAEVNYLRRTVQSTKQERWELTPVKETIKRIIFDQDFTLELYKSKEHKLELLDEAIRCHDGNAIITVTLFLKDTVKAAIFNLELMLRPIAIDHYVSFLKQSGDMSTLIDVYGMLGRSEEAAMTKFKHATSVRDPEKKWKSLEACKRAHFDTEPSLNHESHLVQEQILALTQQLPVEKSDEDLEKAGTDPVMKQYPRAASIIDQPVLTWLFYCSFYHYTLSPNNFASPASIKKVHRLTDKQYLWTALNARAKLKAWKDIEVLFTTKGWLGSTKMKSPLGFHRVVPVLHMYHAPRDILNKYCRLIDDLERRIEVGEKYDCHEAVIETLVQMRDRQKLLAYQGKVKANSPEWFFTGDMLRNSNTKWKN